MFNRVKEFSLEKHLGRRRVSILQFRLTRNPVPLERASNSNWFEVYPLLRATTVISYFFYAPITSAMVLGKISSQA
jgi:hypothetical protein